MVTAHFFKPRTRIHSPAGSRISVGSADGRITGRVTDASGAAIAGAAVTISQLATNQQRSTETSSDGYTRFPACPPAPTQ